MLTPFDPQAELVDEMLQLRPLQAADLEELYLAASSPEVWAGHPSKDRHLREVFEPYAKSLLASQKALAVVDRNSGRIIGSSSYYISPDEPASIAVGFTFLHHSYWGGATNFRLKRLMLEHAFGHFGEVWFHVAPANVRSQRAILKLGATHTGNAILKLAGEPALWMCFRLPKDTWRRVRREREPESSQGACG